jgi:hypothetical protein
MFSQQPREMVGIQLRSLQLRETLRGSTLRNACGGSCEAVREYGLLSIRRPRLSVAEAAGFFMDLGL